MSKRAWAYIWGAYLAAALLLIQALVTWRHVQFNWTVIEILFGLAVAAQLFNVEAPNHVLFYATPVFFFAGTILLDAPVLFLLIAVPHVAEWIKERCTGSSHLRGWYLQPFNIAMYWIACRGAQGLFLLLHDRVAAGTGWELAVVMVAGVYYVASNHTMLAIALVLARGVSWEESGILDGSSFVNDFVLVCVGSIVAALWITDPWFVLPALAPIAFMYRALTIPRLKREAETDPKTGLYNARYFTNLFTAELGRAKRFDRPLAVIMADLDHLREVNNTHGHLAGDAVLVGVAATIHSTVREYDVVARFGGEEFALLLPEVDENQARVLAERLRRAIEASTFTVSTAHVPLRVTMSLGVACYPRHGRTATDLLHAADTAVYVAKTAGRNRVVSAGEVPAVEVSKATAYESPITETLGRTAQPQLEPGSSDAMGPERGSGNTHPEAAGGLEAAAVG